MARIKANPVAHIISGRLGDMVYYNYRGQQYVRKSPRRVETASALQAGQRMRFGAAIGFYRELKRAGFDAFWQRAAKGLVLSGYNLAMAHNVGAFDEAGRIVDFRRLCLTPGSLSLPWQMELQAGSAGGEWLLTWDTLQRAYKGGDLGDLLHAVVMRDEESYAVKTVDCGGACRGDGRAVVRIPEELSGYKHLFCFFSSQAGDATACEYFCLTF